MGTSGEVSSRAMVLQLLLLSCLAATSLAQERENPTWLIPSQEKPRSQDDQSFCEGELAKTSDTDLYQTRTSEILLPEEFPPAVCIIFPFAPDVLRYGAGTRGECHNGCCFFRPPSKNIPDPPPSPEWFKFNGSCEDTSLAVTKPIIMNGKDGEDRTVCVADKDGVFNPVAGKTSSCARQCCLFYGNLN